MESLDLRTMGWVEWRRRTLRSMMKNITDLLEDEEGMEFNVAIRHCTWLAQIGTLLMHVTCLLEEVCFVAQFQLVINELVVKLENLISKSAEQRKGLVDVIRVELQAEDDSYIHMEIRDYDIGLKDSISQSAFVGAVMDQMATPYRVGALLYILNDVIFAYQGFLSELISR